MSQGNEACALNCRAQEEPTACTPPQGNHHTQRSALLPATGERACAHHRKGTTTTGDQPSSLQLERAHAAAKNQGGNKLIKNKIHLLYNF